MPSEHIIASLQDQQQDQPQSQIKFCASCHSTLVDPAGSVFLPDADAIVCSTCRDHFTSARPPPITAEQRAFWFDLANPYPTRPQSHEIAAIHTTRRPVLDSTLLDTVQSSLAPSPSQDSTLLYHGTLITPPTYPNKPNSLTIQCISSATSTIFHQATQTPPLTTSTHSPNVARTHPNTRPRLDPLADITRLRIRSQGHHCLYPGASFEGTQKSGRNSYDVNVTIVDVDFASSFLCGYLRIRGLTDDWPELTTYFDAEIIGSRYGFLTQNWGASEHEDMVHWARFPAFKHVKPEAKKPHMTIEDRDRGAVFMRWKERFLVPDHRVQDINGASFAGFYYVCVDFNPQPASSSPTRSTSQDVPLTPDCDEQDLFSQPSIVPKPEMRARRASSVKRRSPSVAPLSAPVATMSGFYYHQNSEPYQQLSLAHVPERTSSSFEFR